MCLREERVSAGPTHCLLHIRVVEDHAFGREFLEVGRLDAVAVRPGRDKGTEIIAYNDQQILGTRRRGLDRRRRRGRWRRRPHHAKVADRAAVGRSDIGAEVAGLLLHLCSTPCTPRS